MSNLIDRDAMKKYIDLGHLRSPTEICLSELNVIRMLDAQPAIDAVPVVRCGECIHSSRSPFGHPVLRWCPLRDSHRSPDWFCADGRREK